MSEMKEITGHKFQIGDKVKMNIESIGAGDLDGVEFTTTGKNYWRYMNQHPDEIYTVIAYDFSGDETSYILSGEMTGNNWYSDELILVPQPQTYFEAIKSMTFEEMSDFLSNLCRIPRELATNMLNDRFNNQDSNHSKLESCSNLRCKEERAQLRRLLRGYNLSTSEDIDYVAGKLLDGGVKVTSFETMIRLHQNLAIIAVVKKKVASNTTRITIQDFRRLVWQAEWQTPYAVVPDFDGDSLMKTFAFNTNFFAPAQGNSYDGYPDYDILIDEWDDIVHQMILHFDPPTNYPRDFIEAIGLDEEFYSKENKE